jgi:hypothetical protein
MDEATKARLRAEVMAGLHDKSGGKASRRVVDASGGAGGGGGGGGGGGERTYSARNQGYGITGDKVTEALGTDPAKIGAYCGTISEALANHTFTSESDAQFVSGALMKAYDSVAPGAAAPIELLEDGASEDESHLFSSSKK